MPDTAVPMSAADFAKAQRRRFTRPIVIGAAALALVVLLTWWVTDVSQARTFLSDGDTLCRAGRYAEAITTLSATISKRPRQADAYKIRARAYLALTQYEQAKRDLDTAIDLRPKDAEALEARAALMIVWQGCSQEAVEDLTRALDLAPTADAFARRGACLRNLGQTAEAVQDLTRAMELDPAADHYLERAAAYSALGDHVRAVADLDKAIQKQPSLPDSYSLRAGEKEKLGDANGAAEDRKRASETAAAGALH